MDGKPGVACQIPPPLAPFGAEQQTFGKWIPGRAVELGQRVVVRVRGRQQRHPMLEIGIQVDPGDIAVTALAALMALEQKPAPVVVAVVGTTQVRQHQVGVLVRLGLGGLDVAAQRGQLWAIVVVAVVSELARRVLQRDRALGDDLLGQFGREHVRGCDADGFGIGVLHGGETGGGAQGGPDCQRQRTGHGQDARCGWHAFLQFGLHGAGVSRCGSRRGGWRLPTHRRHAAGFGRPPRSSVFALVEAESERNT